MAKTHLDKVDEVLPRAECTDELGMVRCPDQYVMDV
jgi:hypothetical protein